MPIPAIVGALLPTLIAEIPKLGALFGSGSAVSQRNQAAAGVVLDIVQKATNTPNAQAAVEAVQASPEAKAAATKAVEEQWYQLTEAGGGGIAAARAADQAVMFNDGPWWQVVRSPSFLFLLLAMPTVWAIVGSIVGLWGTEWPSDVRAAIATVPPAVARTAQYLNSGIFATGSSAGFVSLLIAASTQQKAANTVPGGELSSARANSVTAPRRVLSVTGSPGARPSAAMSCGCSSATGSGSIASSTAARRVMLPVCQCSSWRPVISTIG